jgi:single-strand DNA-binding protein
MSVGEIYVDVQGRVGGEVKFKHSTSGVAMASFRLASTPRFYSRADGGWSDKPTTWFTVECWRTLAENVMASIGSGQPVLVTGRLKTTEWVDENGEQRSKTVIDAFSVGHDLNRGTAQFRKNPPRANQLPDTLRDEMRELSDVAESQEENPFHDDDREFTGPFASGPLIADLSAAPVEPPMDDPSDRPSGPPSERPSDNPPERPSERPSDRPSADPFDGPFERPGEGGGDSDGDESGDLVPVGQTGAQAIGAEETTGRTTRRRTRKAA